MVKKIFATVCAIIICSFAIAQTAVISGNAKSYAGDTLCMYAVTDYISKTEKLIATAPVNAEGDFSFKIQGVDHTFMAYIDLTVFKGVVIVQPKANITIGLPKKQQLAIEDRLNPYFKPEKFYVFSVSASLDDLNNAIPMFDREYNLALNKVFYSFQGVSKAYVDSVEAKITAEVPASDKFFTDYREYKYALFDHTAYRRNKNDILQKLFTSRDVLVNNPAYNELFDELFVNPLSGGKASVITVQGLYAGIYDKSYHTLKRILLTDPALSGNERLADYVILKGLSDSYYADTFPKENIVAVADSFAIMSKNADFRPIAQRLSEKFKRLLTGFSAPDFCLKDVKGNAFTLSEQKKFVYITFFNPMSYTAQSEFEFLKKIRSEFPTDVLQIVTVFVSQSYKEMEEFMTKNPDCTWPVVWYNDNTQLLKDYNIRAYPSYYMTGPDGRLVMNPAPAPTEYFEAKFSKLVRDWKIEQTRRQYRDDGKTLR
ncbi:MAG: redoxin domain-containing protein [Bacteroidales bacterium]|nr:redoxin domain-containing protein [Bacteroidales bacterium]